MQVFGLPGHVIRNGRRASRLIDAETTNIAAAIRSDAVRRWRQAMSKGLTADDAAKVIGHPRSTLYRWQKQPQPKSRRPHRIRKAAWSPALAQAVEELRADNPMWGKRKLVWLRSAVGWAKLPQAACRRGIPTVKHAWAGFALSTLPR
jgi:hypothetical protein